METSDTYLGAPAQKSQWTLDANITQKRSHLLNSGAISDRSFATPHTSLGSLQEIAGFQPNVTELSLRELQEELSGPLKEEVREALVTELMKVQKDAKGLLTREEIPDPMGQGINYCSVQLHQNGILTWFPNATLVRSKYLRILAAETESPGEQIREEETVSESSMDRVLSLNTREVGRVLGQQGLKFLRNVDYQRDNLTDISRTLMHHNRYMAVSGEGHAFVVVALAYSRDPNAFAVIIDSLDHSITEISVNEFINLNFKCLEKYDQKKHDSAGMLYQEEIYEIDERNPKLGKKPEKSEDRSKMVEVRNLKRWWSDNRGTLINGAFPLETSGEETFLVMSEMLNILGQKFITEAEEGRLPIKAVQFAILACAWQMHQDNSSVFLPVGQEQPQDIHDPLMKVYETIDKESHLSVDKFNQRMGRVAQRYTFEITHAKQQAERKITQNEQGFKSKTRISFHKRPLFPNGANFSEKKVIDASTQQPSINKASPQQAISPTESKPTYSWGVPQAPSGKDPWG